VCPFLSKYSMKVERTLSIGHSGWVANLVFSSDMVVASVFTMVFINVFVAVVGGSAEGRQTDFPAGSRL